MASTEKAAAENVAQLSRQLVVFSLGEEEYALPITHVQEIIRYAEPRALASDAPWIRGVISLRGKIIPVFDLGSRLGIAAATATDPKIVIVETTAGTAGVIVADVEEVLTVQPAQLDAVPTARNNFIDAIAKIDDRLIVLLNAEGVFGGIELAA